MTCCSGGDWWLLAGIIILLPEIKNIIHPVWNTDWLLKPLKCHMDAISTENANTADYYSCFSQLIFETNFSMFLKTLLYTTVSISWIQVPPRES